MEKGLIPVLGYYKTSPKLWQLRSLMWFPEMVVELWGFQSKTQHRTGPVQSWMFKSCAHSNSESLQWWRLQSLPATCSSIPVSYLHLSNKESRKTHIFQKFALKQVNWPVLWLQWNRGTIAFPWCFQEAHMSQWGTVGEPSPTAGLFLKNFSCITPIIVPKLGGRNEWQQQHPPYFRQINISRQKNFKISSAVVPLFPTNKHSLSVRMR